MKTIVTAVLAISLLNSAAAVAQPYGPPGRDQNNQDRNGPGYGRGPGNDQGRGPGNDQGRGNDRGPGPDRGRGGPQAPRFSKGDRLPPQYLDNRHMVSDYRGYGLRAPPRGYRWAHDDDNNFFLVLLATGVIADIYMNNDRNQRWDQRHARTYTYNDDVYYQQCRSSSDPAGVIVGALIGGLLGNAAGNRNNRGASTAAGVILGGAAGAALTKNMDCNDRSYAYKTYYNGLNSERPGSRYTWRNPDNGHRGDFTVGRYYNDPDNFRCADFTQTIYINGRPDPARGTACRQPDGSWKLQN